MQRMTVLGLSVDPTDKSPMVVLKSEVSGALLPVWLGASEALHLSMAQNPIPLASPLVHESVMHLICELGGTMLNCSVIDVREGIFTVTIELQVQDRQITVPCRFSDGVALALRMGAPVFVATQVLHKVTADRSSPTASSAARRPSDRAEHLVSSILPDYMQEALQPKQKKKITITHGKLEIKRKETPESVQEKLLRDMKPASRRIM